MDLKEQINAVQSSKDLSPSDIELYWTQSLDGKSYGYNKLKFFYMKQLLRIRPLYPSLNDHTFYELLEKSVSKALDRGLKFQVNNYHDYMKMASESYFKYFLLPNQDSLHIPAQLLKAYLKLDEVYSLVPELSKKIDESQILLLSKSFEYPIFSTRLLYYSFIKWKNDSLRQVDIDLTVQLLPTNKRIEWEIFYEKPIHEIRDSIQLNLDG